jgi:tetrahydromethanopterin S-methyltransferase subunit C
LRFIGWLMLSLGIFSMAALLVIAGRTYGWVDWAGPAAAMVCALVTLGTVIPRFPKKVVKK